MYMYLYYDKGFITVFRQVVFKIRQMYNFSTFNNEYTYYYNECMC